MPKYTYVCKKCDNFSFIKIIRYEDRNNVNCPKCSELISLTPFVSEVAIYEKSDPYRNKSVRKGINDIMKKRALDHVKKHELGEFIEKQGLDTAKKVGFVKEDE